MEHFPLVSIVTPAYNQAEYLAETIESVLAQDYPNIEYIVLDDGSTDSTPEVLKRYNDRVYWERQENMGQARTLNKGWSMARGSLLGYLSSDDRLKPNAISEMVRALTKQPEFVVAYCDFDLIDAKGRIFRTVKAENFNAKRLNVDLVCQPGPGALFLRKVFEQTGGWAGQLRQIPDFEFWLRSSKFGPFVRVPQVLAEYRVHEGSASFAPTTAERSMEIVDVMTAYWDVQTGYHPRRALAKAYLLSAKSHAQSSRIHACVLQFKKALSYNPSLIWSLETWLILISGFLRRTIYCLKMRNK